MFVEIKLYYTFIAKYIKSKLEYKFSIIVETIANMINIGSYYMFLIVIFQQVASISGWDYYESIFLVSLNWLSTAVCGFFFWAPMMSMGQMIKDGTFDGLLIRPIHPLRFSIYRQFQYTFVGRLILAIGFLAFSMYHLSISWSFVRVIYFIVILISGVFIHGGLQIIMGATAFWVIDNKDIVNLIASYDGIRTFIDFPMSAFNLFINVFFTFIMPYAFVNFYPSIYFLNKGADQSLFSPIFQFGSPLVGAFVFLLGVLLWYHGLKRYSGSGS